MALKTNYVDYVAPNGVRKFQMKNNSDGTITLTDVTAYTTIGDNVGASDLNAITQAIVGVTLSGIDLSTYAFAQGIVYLCDSTCTNVPLTGVSYIVKKIGTMVVAIMTSGSYIGWTFFATYGSITSASSWTSPFIVQ